MNNLYFNCGRRKNCVLHFTGEKKLLQFLLNAFVIFWGARH